jgi:methylglutaconyl-CoA hydratase
MGLVHRVVPADQTRNEALRLADLVLQGGPGAVRKTKRLISDLNRSSELEGIRIAHQYHRDARVGEEAREGLAAFLEKRLPLWVDGGSRP